MSNARTVFEQISASVAERVARDPLLPDEIRAKMKREIETLRKGFLAIDRLGNERLSISTLQAITAAIYVGVYEVAGTAMLPGLFKEYEKQRMRPTNAGRRREMALVKPIIDRQAYALWERNPDLRHRPAVTAGRIAAPVHREVFRLPRKPPGWPTSDHLSVEDGKKVRDRIRKHLPT